MERLKTPLVKRSLVLAAAAALACACVAPPAPAAAPASECTAATAAYALVGQAFAWSVKVTKGGAPVPDVGVGFSIDNGTAGEWYELTDRAGVAKQRHVRTTPGVHHAIADASVEKPGGEREYEQCTATQLLVATPKRYAAAGSVEFGSGRQAGFYAGPEGGALQAQLSGSTLVAGIAPAVSISGTTATLSGPGSWNGEPGASYVLRVTAAKSQPATVALSVTVGEATVYSTGGALPTTAGTVKIR